MFFYKTFTKRVYTFFHNQTSSSVDRQRKELPSFQEEQLSPNFICLMKTVTTSYTTVDFGGIFHCKLLLRIMDFCDNLYCTQMFLYNVSLTFILYMLYFILKFQTYKAVKLAMESCLEFSLKGMHLKFQCHNS